MITIDQFRTLTKTLDDVAAKCDVELMGREDIGGPMKDIAAYLLAFDALPKAIGKLEAEKLRIDARRDGREAAIRRARHPLTMLDAKLKKLGETLEHNVAAAASEKPAEVSASAKSAGLPPTRQARVEELRSEIAAVEAEKSEPLKALKKAEGFLKGDATRLRNIDAEILKITAEIAALPGRLDEMAESVHRTVRYLKNRQAKRDRKAAEKAAKPSATVDAVIADETPPSDDEIIAWASGNGLPVTDDNDLQAARELFAA